MRISQLALAFGFLAILGVVALGIWLGSRMLTQGSEGARTALQGFTSFLPYGQPVPGESIIGTGAEIQEEPIVRMRRVSDAPVAGAAFFEENGRPILRFVERETGHIYDASPANKTLVRRSNTTIPAVMNAFFLNATSTLMRVYETPDSVRTILGTLGTTTEEDATLATTNFTDYASIAVQNGSIVGIRRTTQGAEVDLLSGGRIPGRTVTRTSLTSWIPALAGASVYLTASPSGTALGSSYAVSRSGLVRIIGPLPGLEILPSDTGKTLLASEGGANRAVLGTVTNIDSFVPLPFETFIEKCTWASKSDVLVICAIPKSLPVGIYPDAWKLGEITTADEFWSVDLETGATIRIADPETEGVGVLDAHQLTTDPTNQYLAFINRTDMSLWILSLETPETGE